MGLSLAPLLGGACVACRRAGPVVCRACRPELKIAGPVGLPGLDRTSAVWRHEGPARALVLGLKLGANRACADVLVEGLVRTAVRTGTGARVVTWPPCSRSDRLRRGFDHAELLAHGVAAHLGLPARPLLERVKLVSDQASLGGPERRTNLAGAFTAVTPAPAEVLLVDDVVTTGATLQACASALRLSGARSVEALVACSAFL